jgi:uncharacterized protein YutE (UPF0331/DUF86 family)
MALDDAVRTLREHQGGSVDDLESERAELWMVERGLQLCAQNALDIATHLAASAGHDVPEYAAAIDRIAEMGVLPRPFAESFRSVAGFRNVVVHGYLDVDVTVVHRLLNERLDDFTEFARHVDAYLVSQPEG